MYNCHADANCTYSRESFHCTCHTGYSGDGVTCVGKITDISTVINFDDSESSKIFCGMNVRLDLNFITFGFYT